MFNYIRTKWKEFCIRIRKKRDLSTENFKALASEIRGIAELSSRLHDENPNYQEKIRRIRLEMDQLDQLLANKSFLRLPMNKKEELRKSLLVSKEELMRSLRSAPCPTDRIQ